MEVKGLNKLNKTLKKVFKKFDVNKFYPTEDEFECVFSEKAIGYTLIENLPHNNYYIEFVKRHFHYEPVVPFMLFLFHEIGHLYTDNFTLNKYTEIKRNNLYEKMENLYTNDEQFKSYEFEYFMLPDEIVATAWAIDYMRNHEKEVQKMWKEIYNALQKFYKLNNITEE